MLLLTPRQATLLHGWVWTKPTLIWADVLSLNLTLDKLLAVGLSVRDLVMLQPDPEQWVKHAGAGMKHMRMMIVWPANPFDHFGADLADLLATRPTVSELVKMDVTYDQLVRNGMTARTEAMFKFCAEEWEVLGR